jgi:hypothetical protein
MKPVKSLKSAHTSNMKKGMGTFTGQGVKNPVGKVRSAFTIDTPQKMSTKKAPKSLA